MAQDLHTVIMRRQGLAGITPTPLPAPFTVRPYRDSRDQQGWLDIHRLADEHQTVTETHFKESYGDDEAMLRQRLFFVEREQQTVATAAAWFGDADSQWSGVGRIHWVAVVPGHQSCGIGHALVTHLLMTFRNLGHRDAYLTTDHIRLPAIRLYRSLGFIPHIDRDFDRRLWDDIDQQLAKGEKRAGR